MMLRMVKFIYANGNRIWRDMVADSDNNFYIFAASGNVFKVSAKELKAKFIGKIAGIPDNYSVNGSAVNARERW